MSTRKTKFSRWLKKKGMTLEGFAKACNPPVHYGTVANWAGGAVPRDFFKETLKPQWPDCPLFTTK